MGDPPLNNSCFKLLFILLCVTHTHLHVTVTEGLLDSLHLRELHSPSPFLSWAEQGKWLSPWQLRWKRTAALLAALGVTELFLPFSSAHLVGETTNWLLLLWLSGNPISCFCRNNSWSCEPVSELVTPIGWRVYLYRIFSAVPRGLWMCVQPIIFFFLCVLQNAEALCTINEFMYLAVDLRLSYKKPARTT